MLKEGLETLRFVHRLIIGVIAATFIFALSPNPKQIAYEQLEQLDVLHQAASNYDKFRRDVNSYAKQYNDKSICYDAAKKFLSTKDISVSKTKSSLGSSSRSGSFPNRIQNYPYYSDDTLNGISEKMLLPLMVYTANSENLMAALSQSELSKLEPGSKVALNVSIMASSGLFIYPSGHKKIPSNPDWVCLFSTYTETGSFYSDVSFSLNEQKIPIKTWGHWLYDNPKTQSLVKLDGTRVIAFPGLRDVWYELGPLTFEEAMNRLKNNLKSRQDALEVMGFSIEAASALLILPIFLLVSLLYFCTHASHCLRIISNDVEILNNFPWMGLYFDKIGSTVTYLTLAVLPVLSLLLLLLNAQTNNQVVVISASLLTFLSLLAGIYASTLVYRIRLLRGDG